MGANCFICTCLARECSFSRGWSDAVEIPAGWSHNTVFSLPKPACSPPAGSALLQEHLYWAKPMLGPWAPEVSKTQLLSVGSLFHDHCYQSSLPKVFAEFAVHKVDSHPSHCSHCEWCSLELWATSEGGQSRD